MTVRSTQLRPSQQSRGATRAVAFAASASRRSGSLDAAIGRSQVSSVASPMVIANPNRTTRRWGTVAVSENRSAADSARARSAIAQARAEHPTASGRKTGTDGHAMASSRSTRSSTYSSTDSPTPGPRPTGSGSTETRSIGARSNVVALHPKVTQRRDGQRGPSANSGPVGSVGAGPRLLTLGTQTVGATALAAQPEKQPSPRQAKPKSATSKSALKPNLRVARPPRRVRRRLASRPATVFFAIALVVAGAVSAIVLHADLAQNQLVLDQLRVEVAEEERTNQRLRVEVAELEAPARLISAARELGLVPAERVDYTAVDSTPNGR